MPSRKDKTTLIHQWMTLVAMPLIVAGVIWALGLVDAVRTSVVELRVQVHEMREASIRSSDRIDQLFKLWGEPARSRAERDPH